MVAVLVGGLVEIIPMFLVKQNVPTIAAVKPYTPLEVLGRDIYIREGCVGCHSQMIRPFRSETERYGEYSKAGEFVYDHPFLWGSKRTGPDLHRVGGKYPDAWHFHHMDDPRSTSPGSIMPPYPWLLTQKLDTQPHRGQDHHAAARSACRIPRVTSVRRRRTCSAQAAVDRRPASSRGRPRRVAPTARSSRSSPTCSGSARTSRRRPVGGPCRGRAPGGAR